MNLFSWFRRRSPKLSMAEMQERRSDYLFGESDAEISRLDMQHYMFRREFGNDYLAPVDPPAAVLDVACGTGRWARDMASRFPEAVVIGFDINRVQIDHALAEGAGHGGEPLPANCTLLAGDALQYFDFSNASFDLVMARATSAFVPIARYPHIVSEMTRVARPGGWIELRDFGLVRSKSRALAEMTSIFAKLTAERGSYPGAGPYLLDYARGAGLHNIQTRVVTVRSGPQASRGGRLMITDYLAVMERIGPLIAQTLQTPPGYWERLLAQARQETVALPTEVDLTAVCGQR